MVGDADGYRDDANFDLYKKFVKIVISVNKLILSLRFLSLIMVSLRPQRSIEAIASFDQCSGTIENH